MKLAPISENVNWVWQYDVMQLKRFFDKRRLVVLLGVEIHDLPRTSR